MLWEISWNSLRNLLFVLRERLFLQNATFAPGNAFVTWFPEMLEYTFPDLLMTVRNPAPVTSRNMSNFTLVSHLKNEIECRYLADVRYLKENRIPFPGFT